MWVLSVVGLLAQFDSGEVQHLRHAFIEARTPKACGASIRELTRRASVPQLNALCGDSHVGVASFASLELLARAGAESPAMFVFEHGRFTGRLERAFGLTAPTDVILAVRSVVRPNATTGPAVWPVFTPTDADGLQRVAEFKNRDEFYFAGERTAPKGVPPRGTRRYLLGGCLFAGITDGIEWRVGKSRGVVELPKGDEFLNSLCHAIGHATETHCIAYFFAIMGNGGILQVYECASAKQIWTVRVWGTDYSPFASSGPAVQSIKVYVNSDHVTLLGLVPVLPHFYIERFSLTTGKPEGRFATNYWQRIVP